MSERHDTPARVHRRPHRDEESLRARWQGASGLSVQHNERARITRSRADTNSSVSTNTDAR